MPKPLRKYRNGRLRRREWTLPDPARDIASLHNPRSWYDRAHYLRELAAQEKPGKLRDLILNTADQYERLGNLALEALARRINGKRS
jgi:hypothetical protein